MRLRGLLVVTCLLAWGGDRAPAAKGWSTPAAGPSLSGDPEIVFTFDDGPSAATTPKVLDILAKHDIKAIFFLVGEMAGGDKKKIPPIIARILADGHVIANHTMQHKDLCRTKTSDEAAAKDIDDGKATIEKVAGINTFWFRTPFGVRCDRLDAMLAARGISHFHWDLDPQEWKHENAKKAFDYVTGSLAKSTGRNVLLMHDIKKATVEALPQILDWIEAENTRRAAAHKRQIRIIQAPELAAERIPPELRAWAEDAVPRRGGLGARIASILP
ncbi:MAG: polysaccharide deacetylase family protein [Deltaproteobacteria bacterium]|nr:polysaccharide deacetylase family protein [Deltaproteobacteria bacterium]